MNKQIFVLAAGAALLTAAAQSSFAGSVPAGSMNYQVVLEESCQVESFNGGSSILDLGSQPSYAGDKILDNIGSVTITCANMLYGICVSGGSNADGSTRRLKDTAVTPHYLNYDLRNAADNAQVGDNNCNVFAGIGTDTAAWANPIGGAVSVGPPRVAGIPGTGSSQSFSMKAIVTIPTNSIPGVYTDNGVQLTIVW